MGGGTFKIIIMPGQNYKELFDRVNESRSRRGDKPLTWAQFLGKELKEIHREKVKMLDHVESGQAQKIQRPPAVYSNKSIYDKYNV